MYDKVYGLYYNFFYYYISSHFLFCKMTAVSVPYLWLSASVEDCSSSREGPAIRGMESWRRQGDRCRCGCLKGVGDAREPAGGWLKTGGATLANSDSWLLMNSSINTWTSAAPGTKAGDRDDILDSELHNCLLNRSKTHVAWQLPLWQDVPPMMLWGSSALARMIFGPKTVARFWSPILLLPE